MCYIFVWTIRTSAKLFNGTFTPYEVITGLKPRSPLDAMFGQSGVQRVSRSEYVNDLVEYLKHVHKIVDDAHSRVRDSEERAKLREQGVGTFAKVGEFVLVARPKQPGVSARFQRPHFDEIYQVVDTHGEGPEAKAYTVCDSRGRRDVKDLGFTNPVAADRITPIDVLSLTRPDNESRTRIAINNNGVLREGTVLGQRFDGTVHIEFDDDPTEIQQVDLTTSKYHWVS